MYQLIQVHNIHAMMRLLRQSTNPPFLFVNPHKEPVIALLWLTVMILLKKRKLNKFTICFPPDDRFVRILILKWMIQLLQFYFMHECLKLKQIIIIGNNKFIDWIQNWRETFDKTIWWNKLNDCYQFQKHILMKWFSINDWKLYNIFAIPVEWW